MSTVVTNKSYDLNETDKRRISIEPSAIVNCNIPCYTTIESRATIFSATIVRYDAIKLLVGMDFI